MPVPPALNAPMLLHGGIMSRTLAHATDSRKNYLILLACVLSCVINGDTLSGVLGQATRLTIAVIVLIVVWVVGAVVENRLLR